MKPKWVIYGTVATVGLLGIALWAYRKVTHITVEGVSSEWLSAAEYNREGYQD